MIYNFDNVENVESNDWSLGRSRIYLFGVAMAFYLFSLLFRNNWSYSCGKIGLANLNRYILLLPNDQSLLSTFSTLSKL